MKIFLTVLFLMLPVAATAENQATNNTLDVEKMMQLMQEVEQCMAKIDQSAMDEFEKEADKIGSEIEELCIRGNRTKAQKKAVALGKKAMKNPVLLQMQKCGEITKGLIPGQSGFSLEEAFDFSDKHVCDE